MTNENPDWVKVGARGEELIDREVDHLYDTASHGQESIDTSRVRPARICTFPDCGRGCVRSHALCRAHLRQQRMGWDLRPVIGTEQFRRAKDDPCSFPDCGRKINAKGLCGSHGWQAHRGHELRPIGELRRPQLKPCSFPECDQPHKAKGFCWAHYGQVRRGQELAPLTTRVPAPDECTYPDCGRLYMAKGWCSGHYAQARRGEDLRPLKTQRAFECDGKSAECRAEHFSLRDGYRLQYHQHGHPNADKSGHVSQHKLVMEQMIGRYLSPGENVHHKNGVRDDNRPENLELWVTSQPWGQRTEDLLEWADEIIARYRTRPHLTVVDGGAA